MGAAASASSDQTEVYRELMARHDALVANGASESQRAAAMFAAAALSTAEAAAEQVLRRPAYDIVVGCCGTQDSAVAFDVALTLTKMSAAITTLHFYGDEAAQAALPPAQRAVAVRTALEVEMTGLGSRGDVQTLELGTETVKAATVEWVNAHSASVLSGPTLYVCGYRGRQSMDETSGSVLGSTADMALSEMKCATLIAKQRLPSETSAPRCVAVAVAGDLGQTECHHYAAALALVRPVDRLIVVTIVRNDTSEAAAGLESQFASDFAARGLANAAFVAHDASGAADLAASLLGFTQENEVDVLCIGESIHAAGRAEDEDFRMATEAIVRTCKCNVLVAKS